VALAHDPTRKAVELAVQICQGLAAAHARGIVHRDLKPENLFLTNDGRLKILDFDLAKLKETPEREEELKKVRTHTATEQGLLLGTVGYMSPEQARGQPADARSDLFALGAIFYEMLSGRRAFEGATPADVLSAILTSEAPETCRKTARCPRRWSESCAAAWRKTGKSASSPRGTWPLRWRRLPAQRGRWRR
jgi:serine/threonine protein kinase